MPSWSFCAYKVFVWLCVLIKSNIFEKKSESVWMWWTDRLSIWCSPTPPCLGCHKLLVAPGKPVPLPPDCISCTEETVLWGGGGGGRGGGGGATWRGKIAAGYRRKEKKNSIEFPASAAATDTNFFFLGNLKKKICKKTCWKICKDI